MTKCKTCGQDRRVIVRVGKSKDEDECSDCYLKRIRAKVNAVKI